MPNNVKKSIEDLKVELKQTPRDTSGFEEALEAAKNGVDRFTPEAVQELVQILQRESGEFEVEHPRITALINNVMTSLSNLGI